MAGSIQEIRAYGRPSDQAEDAGAGPPDDPGAAERAANARADAKYQAFVMGGPTNDPCANYGSPDHLFDQCVKEDIPNSVLFEKEGIDSDPISPSDILQGRLGDCYVLAPLAAMAATPDGRALLRAAVVENKGTNGEVVGYSVTFHQPTSHLFGKTTFEDVRIDVGGPYVVGHAGARRAGSDAEVWPLVVEKAYAQYAGGYDAIDRGGCPADIMTLLTGREATRASLEWPHRWFKSYGAAELQADVAAGKMVIFGTKAGVGAAPSPDATVASRTPSADAHGLVGAHAYFLQGTEEHEGRLMMRLGNPWSYDAPSLVPVDELTTWFASVSVGSVR